jgi:hypothetical protein
MNEKQLPPWANEIPEGSFISYEPTYKVGEYFDRFHKDSFTTAEKGKMTYYFFDPTEHGFPKEKSYPLFVFLHGTSNALEGDVCINYTGAEFYAKDDYQSAFGGAYLLIPLANEYRNSDGAVQGYWDDSYTKPVYDLICDFIKTHTYGTSSSAPSVYGASGKKVVFGNSSGATMTFRMVNAYTSFFNALVPIGTDDIPDDTTLDRYDENDVHLFYAIGKRDEFNPFKENVEPRIPRLNRMKHCFLYTPEWVKNGDKGIASINFGVEMGQHCLINPMHCNLMFDDGTIMDERLPKGVTGWLNDMIHGAGACQNSGAAGDSGTKTRNKK